MAAILAPSSKWRVIGDRVECQRGHVIASEADITRAQGRRRCRRCRNKGNSRSAAKVRTAAADIRALRRCLGCGAQIGRDRTKFCSASCLHREHGRINWDRERAEAAGVAFEPVFRLEVYERDGWVCQLCSLPVSWFLEWPHDWSPVLDHRIPLALGGDHVAANVQLAHAICNAWKRDLGPAGFARAVEQIGTERWGLARA